MLVILIVSQTTLFVKVGKIVVFIVFLEAANALSDVFGTGVVRRERKEVRTLRFPNEL